VEIYNNEKFKIISKKSNILIINNSNSTTINEINNILSKIPRIKLTEFSNLKKSISTHDGTELTIGILKSKYEITTPGDNMKTYLKINMSENEFIIEKPHIIKNINNELIINNIKNGIKNNVLNINNITPNKKILIAEGICPEPGNDAILRYYKISDKKAIVDKHNNTNHYEIHLIDNVVKNEWVGEKIPATIGKDGINVLGDSLPGNLGKDYKLNYDKKTITLIEKDNKKVLLAKNNGAILIKNGKITIENNLIIDGDVDYNTGNINFDGYVTIKGTVKDNFTVIATKNITINSIIGVGAVKKIESTHGDINIKGGINGKNISEICAGGNIYAKFINETTVFSKNTVNIDLYAKDSIINAKNIFLNSKNGRIIGGNLKAKYKIESHSIGNKYEKLTKVNIEGFDRELLIVELQTLKIKFERLLSKGNTLKRKLVIFETNEVKLDEKALNTFKALKTSYENIITEINEINNKINKISDNLKTKGSGEIKIYDTAYPKTIIEIKNFQKRLKCALKNSLCVKDNELIEF
jgi:uncharacterized protein (DUF342 family)